MIKSPDAWHRGYIGLDKNFRFTNLKDKKGVPEGNQMNAKQCLVCENMLSRNSVWPTCSVICFWILTEALNYAKTSCWILQEVYCRRDACIAHSEAGLDECEVFKTERVIRENGLDKAALIGNY